MGPHRVFFKWKMRTHSCPRARVRLTNLPNNIKQTRRNEQKTGLDTGVGGQKYKNKDNKDNKICTYLSDLWSQFTRASRALPDICPLANPSHVPFRYWNKDDGYWFRDLETPQKNGTRSWCTVMAPNISTILAALPCTPLIRNRTDTERSFNLSSIRKAATASAHTKSVRWKYLRSRIYAPKVSNFFFHQVFSSDCVKTRP